MLPQKVMIIVGTPESHVEPILEAIAAAGGGTIGEYTHCSFMNPGTGSFMPGDSANPHTGGKSKLNRVPEIRIETFCERSKAKQVVAAIRAAHPYEEAVIYIVPLLDENTL
ncbi:MAG: hypothetical protein ACPG7F_06995 [Aggregatilineales bacterium]